MHKHFALPLRKGLQDPKRIFSIFLAVAVVVAGCSYFLAPRKAEAAGTRPYLGDDQHFTSGVSDYINGSLTLATYDTVALVGLSYRNLDSPPNDAADIVQVGGYDMNFVCRSTGDGYTSEFWYLSAPTTGIDLSVDVFFTNSVDDIVLNTIGVEGADTSNPIADSACTSEAIGTSTHQSASVTSPNDYGLEIGFVTTYSGGNVIYTDIGNDYWYQTTTNIFSKGLSNDSTGGVDIIATNTDIDWPWSEAMVDINGIQTSGFDTPVLEGANYLSYGTTDTITLNHTIAGTAGLNPFVVAIASYRNTGSSQIDTATYGGENMTLICKDSGDEYVTEMWVKSAPLTGGQDTVLTWGNTEDDVYIGVTSFLHVNLASPYGDFACNNQTSGVDNTPDVTVTTTSITDLIFGAMTTYTDDGMDSYVTNGDSVWNDRNTNVISSAATLAGSNASDTLVWQNSDNPAWSTAAIVLHGEAQGVPRGVAGDLWADREVGRRDFAEISPGQIDSAHLSAPGGVVIDPYISTAGVAYVWDSGNSRIVEVDLDDCHGDFGNCVGAGVIGQPSLDDYGACNQDASFENNPNRVDSSASTLCGIPEYTHTVLEDKSFSSMWVDIYGYAGASGHDLYVYDTLNNRVLRYIDPWSTDSIADQVIGQPNFAGNQCNLTGVYGSPTPDPTDSSLCYLTNSGTGGGVVINPDDGSLWVADGGNNRVLRFNYDSGTDTFDTNADVILGQSSYTVGPNSYGSGMDQLHSPTSLRFVYDANIDDYRLLVADVGNNRVLTYDKPYSSTMSASGTFGTVTYGLEGIDYDLDNTEQVFLSENNGYSRVLTSYNPNDGNTAISTVSMPNPGGGSLGFDTQSGTVFAATYVYGQNITEYDLNDDLNNLGDAFVGGTNGVATDGSRFYAPGWTGTVVIGNQLFAAEDNLLYWNNPSTITNGQAPDGYLNSTMNTAYDTAKRYTQLKKDNSGNLWALSDAQHAVDVFETPTNVNDSPFAEIVFNSMDVAGGGTVTLGSTIGGIAISPDSNYLWVSDTNNHRVVRIHNPLTSPVVDVVIGQNDLSSTDCNQGIAVDDYTLCYPGTLSLDNFDNLYISDSFLEAAGNLRLLMYHADIFPTNPGSLNVGFSAQKIFDYAAFEVSFDASNRMYAGANPYTGVRKVNYWDNPTYLNPFNASDSAYNQPDGNLNDFSGWVIATDVDQANNVVYTFDANRGQLRAYDQPFTQDSINPSVTITTPADESDVSDTNVTVESSASDNQGVYKVEYAVDGDYYDVAYGGNWGIQIYRPDFANGAHTITATAFDGAGNTSTNSVNVNFTDATDNTPPTVSITSPGNGTTVAGTVAVNTNASDDTAVDHATLFVDGDEYSTISNAPWNFSWDASVETLGAHTLQVQAFDAAGNNAYSSIVTVSVTDNSGPSVDITSPTDGSTVTRNTKVMLTADATDVNGVRRVDFYVNGIRKCAATSGFSCQWVVPRAAGGTYVISAVGIDGSGNTSISGEITVTAP